VSVTRPLFRIDASLSLIRNNNMYTPNSMQKWPRRSTGLGSVSQVDWFWIRIRRDACDPTSSKEQTWPFEMVSWTSPNNEQIFRIEQEVISEHRTNSEAGFANWPWTLATILSRGWSVKRLGLCKRHPWKASHFIFGIQNSYAISIWPTVLPKIPVQRDIWTMASVEKIESKVNDERKIAIITG